MERDRRAREKSQGSDPRHEARLANLRDQRLVPENHANPFVQSWREKRSVLVEDAKSSLAWLYAALTWQPAARALICPLMHERECEGILYVDRAFVAEASQPVSGNDRELLESLCYHFAGIAQPLRLGRQLHKQVLGVSHKLISPISSVCELAEALSEAETDLDRKTFVQHIIAESKRAAHTARTLLRAAAGEPVRPEFRIFELGGLLRERLSPYLVLLRADGVAPRIILPAASVEIEGDPNLLGDVFSELADNARTALLVGNEPPNAARFKVCCRSVPRRGLCHVVITNSGVAVAPDLQSRLFERYVSGSGSTGLGLPLVKAVVQAHGGRISFRPTKRNYSRFLVTLLLKQH